MVFFSCTKYRIYYLLTMKQINLLFALLIATTCQLWAQEPPADALAVANQSQKENYAALVTASQQAIQNLNTGAFAAPQAASTTSEEAKLFQEFSFIPLPVIASNPASGFMFGVAPSMSWLMGDKSTTSRSSVVSTILYTTKKQFMIFVKSNVFLTDDSWNLLGDWRYFATSQPTYGLGTGPSSSKLAYADPKGTISDAVALIPEFDDASMIDGVDNAQLMKFNYLRIHQTFLKKVGDSRFFGGLGYHLDIHSKIDDQLLDTDASDGTIAITSRYAYAIDKGFNLNKTTLSGVSFNALYDSRDNPINPTSGRYAFVNLRVNPQFLGSSKNSTMLWMEYRDYFRLSQTRPRHLIGLWAYGNFVTSGDVPYLDLPAVGWDQFGRSGRGFAQGRWRGQDLCYFEAEYRFPLQKHKDKLSGVLFANATTASSRDNDISLFQYMEPAAGFGLRVLLNKNSGANLTLDYGFGSRGSQGFFLSVNEVF